MMRLTSSARDMLRRKGRGVYPALLLSCHTDYFTVRETGPSAGVVGAFETAARVCADFFGRGGKVRVGS